MQIEKKPVDASAMVTIGKDHPAWQDPLRLGEVDGAFVRIDPPLNASDEDVQRLRGMVSECGAVAVKVLPVRRDRVSSADGATVEQPSSTLRKVVDEAVDGARTANAYLLRSTVEQAMELAGL